MYNAFFGISENPFSLSPDPTFLYRSPQHEEALANLIYGVQSRKGFVVLTGEVGTGKTTMLECMREYLESQYIEYASLFNSRINPQQFFEMIAYDLDLRCDRTSKTDVLFALNSLLIQQANEGRTSVLIVDEAHKMSAPAEDRKTYAYRLGESLSKMTVRKGLKVEMFADESRFPDLINPVQMAFDTKGRLWVAAWRTYPHWKPTEPMNDKLLILEDTNGDGKRGARVVDAGNSTDRCFLPRRCLLEIVGEFAGRWSQRGDLGNITRRGRRDRRGCSCPGSASPANSARSRARLFSARGR